MVRFTVNKWHFLTASLGLGLVAAGNLNDTDYGKRPSANLHNLPRFQTKKGGVVAIYHNNICFTGLEETPVDHPPLCLRRTDGSFDKISRRVHTQQCLVTIRAEISQQQTAAHGGDAGHIAQRGGVRQGQGGQAERLAHAARGLPGSATSVIRATDQDVGANAG